MLSLKVSLLTKTTSLLSVSLTPPTPLGSFLVYMALLNKRTKLLFKSLSLLLVRILLVLGFP